jgi:phosphoserine phosphatase
MENENHDDLIVLHVTGPDRPGITSALTGIIAREGARLVDLGQSVLHGHLTLSAFIEVPQGSDVLRRTLFKASELGLRMEVSMYNASQGDSRRDGSGCALCVTLLGDLEDGDAVGRTTDYLARTSLNIREIRTLSRRRLTGLELIVDLPPDRRITAVEMRALRGEILSMAGDLGADMAVQRDGIGRRSKRLVCMDVDSTFIQMEVIDELAKMAGCGEKVALITDRAMRGELDFSAALRERVSLLAGLPMEQARRLLDDVPMTPGAEVLVRTLKALGMRIGLVSGGFTFLVDALKQRFGLDFAFANTLEVEDGRITGQVRGQIVDADRKAQVLSDMAHVYDCRLDQCVAVGDGANDMKMLRLAGLGIAFRAKPRLQAAADLSLNASSLTGVLYLMGFSERDVAELAGEAPEVCVGPKST